MAGAGALPFTNLDGLRFLSTSLDPVVALNSAIRRGFDNEKLCERNDLEKEVLMIELECCLPAIWGQHDDNCEYELLFKPPFNSKKVVSLAVGDFNLLHVTLGS